VVLGAEVLQIDSVLVLVVLALRRSEECDPVGRRLKKSRVSQLIGCAPPPVGSVISRMAF
jgi:hypothetical protein